MAAMRRARCIPRHMLPGDDGFTFYRSKTTFHTAMRTLDDAIFTKGATVGALLHNIDFELIDEFRRLKEARS